MKSNAPWSVKGIERDARETAKEAARREGMTVGEWLNKVIHTAGEPEAMEGELQGVRVHDLVAAIEHLSRRVVKAEDRSATAVEQLARSFGGVVERVQRLERAATDGAVRVDPTLAARVSILEEKAGDRTRIDALRALERAVAQVALQFDSAQKSTISRLDSTERQLQELASRLDGRGDDNAADSTAVGFLRDTVDALATRLSRAERIASEAAKIRTDSLGSIDTEFVERTGQRLRVLGDEIKRGGDQIRTLEASISRLSEQIDAAERRSSEGVQKVSETIGELREQLLRSDQPDSSETRAEVEQALNALSQRTEDRISSLQRSFETMIERLEQTGIAPAEGFTSTVNAGQSAEEPAFDPDAQEIAEVLAGMNFGEDDRFLADLGDAGAAPGAQKMAMPPTDPAQAASLERPAGASLSPHAPLKKAQASAPAAAASPAAALSTGQRLVRSEKREERFEDDFDFSGSEADDPDSPARLLQEVKAALSNAGAAAKPFEGPGAEDDLDDVLAELDDLGFEDPESGETGVEPPPVASGKTDAFGRKVGTDHNDQTFSDFETGVDDAGYSEPLPTAPGQGPAPGGDFLKAARNAAREAAAQAAAQQELTGGKRRKLTPRERAALLEKIKRKQLEDQVGGANPARPPATARRTTNAAPQAGSAATGSLKLADLSPASGDPLDGDESAPTKRSRGVFSNLGAVMPFIGSRNSPPDAAPDKPARNRTVGRASRAEPGNAAASPIAFVASRPVSAALAGAILLIAVVAYVLFRDSEFSNRTAAPERSGPDQSVAPQATLDAAGAAPMLKDDQEVVDLVSEPLIQPRVLYLDGMKALASARNEDDVRAALKTLMDAAALGHPPAQLQVAELHKMGQGVEKDPAQARLWYERAGTGGNVLAMHRLGVMSARGEGGPVDVKASVQWFESAAELGLVDSQYNLGATYHPSPDGDPARIQNRAKAYFWYRVASRNGDAQAGALAAGLAEGLSPEQRASLDADVARWTPKTPDLAANERPGS